MAAPAEQKATRGRAVGKRRKGREMALQMLYQSEMGPASLAQVLRHFDPSDLQSAALEPDPGDEGPTDRAQRSDIGVLREARQYAQRLVEGTVEHLEELDTMIRSQADNWRLERMSAVDRNVLRLAAYELLHEPDVPKLVVLDEAIELAKRFGSEQSGRFVNGLLDGMLKAHEFPGRLK